MIQKYLLQEFGKSTLHYYLNWSSTRGCFDSQFVHMEQNRSVLDLFTEEEIANESRETTVCTSWRLFAGFIWILNSFFIWKFDYANTNNLPFYKGVEKRSCHNGWNGSMFRCFLWNQNGSTYLTYFHSFECVYYHCFVDVGINTWYKNGVCRHCYISIN